MKSALSVFILLICLHTAGQPVSTLTDSTVLFSSTREIPVRYIALYRHDSSWLPAGLYTIVYKDAERSFQVGDSGLLTGSFRNCYSEKSCLEDVYKRGIKVRSFIKSNERVLEESFDSTVIVMQYNSKKKKWEQQLKNVIVEKTYDPRDRLSTLRYIKGPYNAYASYKFTRGVLISENIPFFQEKKWSPDGQLYEQTIYNWAKKQIEISSFKNGVIYQKMIMKSPANRWTPEGSIEYSTDPNAPIVVTTYTYADGTRVVKKEVDEPRKKTVTEFDTKGKVISVNTYPKPDIKVGVDVAAPVEVKQ